MTNLDSILKSRDITLSTKVHLVKAMVFPVVKYGCESWTIKKAECWRIDAFELWCWRRLLRVPRTARRFNQSTLKEISPGCSLQWRCWSWKSNTLATWYKELTHWKRPWCWERLRAGGEGDDRGWDGWMTSLTQWTWVWVDSGSWWWTRRPGVLQFMGSQRVGHDQATALNWTQTFRKPGREWDRRLVPRICQVHAMCDVLPVFWQCLYHSWNSPVKYGSSLFYKWENSFRVMLLLQNYTASKWVSLIPKNIIMSLYAFCSSVISLWGTMWFYIGDGLCHTT